MGEAAPNLPDDQLPQDEFAPNFGVIEGGGQTTPRKKGHLRAVGDEDLSSQEVAAASDEKWHEAHREKREGFGFTDDISNDEVTALKAAGAVDDDGDDLNYTGDNDDKKIKIKYLGMTKKQAAGTAIGTGLFGIVMLLFLGAAPLQLIQLAQVLAKNESNNQETSDIRVYGLYRFARTGEIGQTRMGYLGSRSVAKTRAQLLAAGIDVTPGRTWGQFREATIDTSKFRPAQGIEDADAALRKVADELKIPQSSLEVVSSANGSHIIRVTENGDKISRKFLKGSTKQISGGIVAKMKFRYLKTFFNLDSLFHPINNVTNRAQNFVANRVEDIISERSRQAERPPPDPPEAQVARSDLRRATNKFRVAASSVLTVTGSLCTIHDSANSIIALNRSKIVVPAVIESADKIAIGAQIAAGDKDLTIEAINAAAESLVDQDGKSVWDGKALEATSGKTNPSGPDITNVNKQAFAGDTTVANIKEVAEGALPEGTLDAACSPTGVLLQAVGSLALLVGTGGTGGTAANFAVRAAVYSARTVATVAITEIITNQIEEFLSEDPFFEVPPSGPLGGNMLAYGAREAANISARASGGIVLGEDEIQAIDNKQAEDDKAEFRSKSFITRMFDVRDYRSVASASIRKIHGSPTRQATNIAAGLGNFGGIVSNLATAFTPKALAAESTYEWNLPRYGTPKNILLDPKYEDPYQVGDELAAVLSDESDPEKGEELIRRAKKCFGVKVEMTPQGWGVTPEKDVNPGSTEYADGHCSDRSDDWDKMMLFVGYSLDMNAIACFDGSDEASCDQFGFNDTSGSDATLNGVTCPENLEPHPTQADYFKMPDAPNGEYTIYADEAQRYGSKQLVCVLYSVALAYNEAMDGKSKMDIGDLNAAGHDSHYKGIAADLDGRGEIVAADNQNYKSPPYSTDATVTLGKLFVDTGLMKNLWWCDNGDGSLDKIIEYANAKGVPFKAAKCLEGHYNHFHIDILDKYAIPGDFRP